MKKVHIFHFHKAYIPAVCFSVAIIASGIIGLATRGLNLGVDFQAGINQTVQLAYPALDVAYNGKGNVSLSVTDSKAVFVLSGADVENKTVNIDFASAPTLGAFASAVQALPDMSVTLRADSATATALLVPSFQGDARLSATPTVLHSAPANASQQFSTTEKVRVAMKGFGDVSVQELKPISLQRYLIRVQDKGKDPDFSKSAPAAITSNLETAFGAERVVIMKTDYVGATYSEALTKQAAFLVLMTILAILVYSTLRFKWQYGIGAVLSTVHDALIMVAFVVWTRMEFNSSTIAAILTILGYSINDTIVQYDRVREDRRLRPNDRFVDVLDTALSETLGRTIITTGTTMIAVLALFFFTSGSLKDMALCLIIGMLSGSYSTVFIASAFVLWWENIKEKRKAKDLALKTAVVFAKKQQAPAHLGAAKKNATKKE